MINVIALSGKKKSGKTETFKSLKPELYKKYILETYLLMPIPNHFQIKILCDYLMVCKINNKRIGILSRCDNSQEYEKYLKELFRLKCDIILTVVHTSKSKSWEILHKYCTLKTPSIIYINHAKRTSSPIIEILNALDNLL